MAITLEEVVQLVINIVRDKEEALAKVKQLEEQLASFIRKPDGTE